MSALERALGKYKKYHNIYIYIYFYIYIQKETIINGEEKEGWQREEGGNKKKDEKAREEKRDRKRNHEEYVSAAELNNLKG